MNKKQKNKKNILFRYELVIAAMLLFAILIITELVRTTVVLADEWNKRAEEMVKAEIPIVPQRGNIYADNGTILAADITFYDACIDFKAEGMKVKALLDTLPALCDSLAHFRPGKSADEWSARIKDELKTRKNRAFRLFEKITDNDVKRLRTFPFLSLPRNKSGFYTTSIKVRTKPYGTMAARSIGNVAEREDREIHGRSGLEMALDSFLYGQAGVAENVQVTTGMARMVKKPAVPGYNITTTINVTLQDIVEQELEKMCVESNAEWGTCVLMEVATGEIKAISNLEWSEKRQKYVEGINHAVLGYEPGSTIKPISMMVALEDGLVSDIDAPIVTGSQVMYEGRPIKDPHGGAALSPRQIIETSSNIGMSKIITSGFSKDKGFAAEPGRFRDRLEEMGFFEPYNTGISGEQVPQMRRLGNTKADRVALTRMCYGYTSLIPPLRTLAMYNAIANDGKYVRPHLVKKFSREGEPDSIVGVTYIRRQVCDSVNAAKLRICLHDVVWGSRGTARNFVQDPDVEIAGKTGTCYTTENGKYTNIRRVSFCGFFPYKEPKYSCIVVMLRPNRGAAASSGVVLRNIAHKMYANGLLGSNGRSEKVENPAPATIYGSLDAENQSQLARDLNIKGARSFATPGKVKDGGVPNVRGLNIREAIAILERAGLRVKLSGTGYVASQSIAPGSSFKRGEEIVLSLQH